MQEPDPPAGPPAPQRLPRSRKKRTVYLKEQLQELRKHFTMNHYPSYEERLSLAARLDLDEHQVQVWLKNRRAKHSRLQGLPKGRGWGAPAVPRGRRDPASVLAPPPSLSPPGPRLGSLLAPPSQGSQASPVWFSTAPRGSLPGGTQSSAPGSMSLPPRPRPSPGSSQASGLPCLGLSPDPMLAPNFTGLLLPQDPLEEPSFPLMSRSQEGDDPADDSDSELRRLLDL